MLLVDLHLHSNASDGNPDPIAIEDHCLKNKIGVALTDHNDIRGSVALIERNRIPCLAGIEVGTQEGLELLVYFRSVESLHEFYIRHVEPFLLDRFMVRSKINCVACLVAAKQLGGFVSLAHPYGFGRKSINSHRGRGGGFKAYVEEIFLRVDGVEIFNGCGFGRSNRQATELQQRLQKRKTVGSDSHTIASCGNAGVEITGDLGSRSAKIFEEIYSGRIHQIKTKRTPFLVTLPVVAMRHSMFFLLKGNARKPILAAAT